jgi:hypothetical protein
MKEFQAINCPLSDFYKWAQKRSVKVPVPEDQFEYLVGKYLV